MMDLEYRLKNYFNTVIMFEVIEYLENYEKFLKKYIEFSKKFLFLIFKSLFFQFTMS